MAKEKRASWFKLFLHQKPLLDAVPDETVGKAVKAAMAYFEDGTIPSLDTLESVIFLSIKPYIEEANSDYEKKSENGKKGGRPKKQTKPEVISQKQNEPEITEAEAEADADAEAEAEGVYVPADKPPQRPRFVPPRAEQVQAYCREKGYTLDVQRFIDYYTSTGWCVGKSPMKDWKAAVRNWQRKETNYGKTEPEPTWTVGIRL